MPIFTTIATAISAALFAGSALATSLIAAGLSLAAKLAISYLTRPKKKPYAAVEGEVQFGGDLARGAKYGTSLVKGQMVYYAKYGAGNKFNVDVLQLADGRCDGLEPEVYFYGKKHVLIPQSITGNEHARYFVTGFGANLEIRFYDGRPGQLADSQLVAATAGIGNPWRATSKGTNTCYVVFQYEYADGLFDQGIPDIGFVLRGLREYDPRFDSTVAGGAGTQRLNNPATWVWTQNPAIHRLNYLLGLKGILSGRTMIGVGMNINQIDVPSHMVAATVCDTTRTVIARTIPTYAASLIVSGDDDHIEILSEFEDAMAGYSANMNGLSGIVVGAPQVVAATLTADDIRIDEPLDVSYRRSGQDSVNILSGQFISREANWTPASLTTVTVNADVLADGRKRPTSNDFLQVTDQDIGQYLLNMRYRQNRKAGKASIPVSRRFGLKHTLGDWISWNGKTWLVSGRSFDERVRVRLELSETGADIYSEAGITPGPIILPPSAPTNPSLLSTVAGFSAIVGLLGDASGVQRPTIQFIWTPPSDPTITQVRFFFRVMGETEEFEAVTTQPETGVFRTSANVLPNRNYEALATITTIPDRVKSYTSWVNCGTTAVDAAISFGLTNMQTDALELLERVTTSIEEVRSLVEQVAHDASTATGMNIVDRRVIRADLAGAVAEIDEERSVRANEDGALALLITNLNASYDAVSASVTSESIARVDADNAIAVQINTLTANYDDVSAAVAVESIARSSDDEALAASITTLSASVGDYTAEGLMGWTVQAGGAGVSARFALEGRVNTGSGWVTGGMYFEIMSAGARRVVFDVDSFIIASALGPEAPFAYDAGLDLVLIKNAYVRNLNATNIDTISITADTAFIENLVVGTSNLDFDSVTENSTFTTSYVLPDAQPTNTWLDAATWVIDNPNPNPVLFINLSFAQGVAANGAGGSRTFEARILRVEGSKTLASTFAATSSAGASLAAQFNQTYMDENPVQGTNTYKLQWKYSGGVNFITSTVSADCKLLWWKR